MRHAPQAGGGRGQSRRTFQFSKMQSMCNPNPRNLDEVVRRSEKTKKTNALVFPSRSPQQNSKTKDDIQGSKENKPPQNKLRPQSAAFASRRRRGVLRSIRRPTRPPPKRKKAVRYRSRLAPARKTQAQGNETSLDSHMFTQRKTNKKQNTRRDI